MSIFLILSSMFIAINLLSQKQYSLVSEILYKDFNHNYFFQYSFPERKYVNEEEITNTVLAYDSLVFFRKKIISLKKVIKPEKFNKLENNYYTDSKYIYAENSFTKSPKFTILDINIMKIKFLEGYIKDDKCVYFKSKKLKNVNAKKFKIPDLDKSYDFGYDNCTIYFEGDEIKLNTIENLPFPESLKNEIVIKFLK